jgi:hypothetical protein
MTQLQKVAVHYTIRLAMCVAAWGLKAAAQRMSGMLPLRSGACPAAACHAVMARQHQAVLLCKEHCTTQTAGLRSVPFYPCNVLHNNAVWWR